MKTKFARKILALIALCALLAAMLVPTAAFADDTYGKPILKTVYANDDTSLWTSGSNATYADGVITLNGYNGDLRPKDIYGKAVGISYDIVGDDNSLEDANNLYVRVIAENNKADYWAVKVMASRGVFIQECSNEITDNGNIPNGGIVDLGAITDKKIAHVDFSMVNTVIYCSLTLEDGTVCEGSVDMSEYYDPSLNYRLSLMNYGGYNTYPSLKIKNVEFKAISDFEKSEAKKLLYKTSGVNADDCTVESDNFILDVTMRDDTEKKSLDSRLYVWFYSSDGKDDIRYRIISDGRLEAYIVDKDGNGTPNDANNWYKIGGLNIDKNNGTFRLIYELKDGVLNVSSVVNGTSYKADAVTNVFSAGKKYKVKIWDQEPSENTVTFDNFEVYEPLGISVTDATLEVKTGADTYAPTAYIAAGASYRATLTGEGNGKLIGALYGDGELLTVVPKDADTETTFEFDIPEGKSNPVIKFFRWDDTENMTPYLEPIVFTTAK